MPLFQTAFTLPSSEESRVPVLYWVNRSPTHKKCWIQDILQRALALITQSQYLPYWPQHIHIHKFVRGLTAEHYRICRNQKPTSLPEECLKSRFCLADPSRVSQCTETTLGLASLSSSMSVIVVSTVLLEVRELADLIGPPFCGRIVQGQITWGTVAEIL